MNATEINNPRLDRMLAMVALQETDESLAIKVLSDVNLDKAELSYLIEDSLSPKWRTAEKELKLSDKVLHAAIQTKMKQYFQI